MTLGELQAVAKNAKRELAFVHPPGGLNVNEAFTRHVVKEMLLEVAKTANFRNLSLDHIAAELEKEIL